MPITFNIDQSALSLVADGRLQKVLGTAFSFIQPMWVVTAKHVVFEEGLAREQILISPYKQPSIRARVLYAHPQVDLAVLELERSLCMRPLFPAHHSLAGSAGLVCAGYAPSKSTQGGPSVLFMNEIPVFEVEMRERTQFTEEVMLFDAAFSEGGHSGGPIFGSDGGVVGAIVENFNVGGRLRARGTSLAPLVSRLCFLGEGT